MVMPLMIWSSGKREPVTEEEKLFVAVCRGEREPVTDAERVRSKYMTRISVQKRFPFAWRKAAKAEGAEDYTEADD